MHNNICLGHYKIINILIAKLALNFSKKINSIIVTVMSNVIICRAYNECWIYHFCTLEILQNLQNIIWHVTISLSSGWGSCKTWPCALLVMPVISISYKYCTCTSKLIIIVNSIVLHQLKGLAHCSSQTATVPPSPSLLLLTFITLITYQ